MELLNRTDSRTRTTTRTRTHFDIKKFSRNKTGFRNMRPSIPRLRPC